jgi:signal transduction histidine kinase
MNSFQPSTVYLPSNNSPQRSRKRDILSLIKKKLQWPWISKQIVIAQERSSTFFQEVRSIGSSVTMSEREKRKLGIFNLLNFLSLLTGFIAPMAGLISHSRIPAVTWIAVFTPAFVNLLVLLLNYCHRYQAGMIAYFILYPVVTSFVYLNGLNPGMDLYFILCGILSVFFIPQVGNMLFSIALSMISYFLLSVLFKNYHYKLEVANFEVYAVNQALAIVFIFYGLYLIKRENTGYQLLLLKKNRELHRINLAIEKQKTEIAEKATLLEEQKVQLENLNSFKVKLFSIISHDLKGPMYALRNLFREMQQNNLPAKQVKIMLPDVVTDLNNTTGLMENLLHWAKSQMQMSSIVPQQFDITEAFDDVLRPLRLSALTKNIEMKNELVENSFVVADKDMICLVFRNLISNAIKFTRKNGTITITSRQEKHHLEVSVHDNGVGISQEQMSRLFNEFYSNNGTADESGTGLGLMLCKEFITKNGGTIQVRSEKDKGSIFSFTVPLDDATG